MRLGSLILKNVLRQKTRTALTLLGISIGIATIITLGAVADGLGEAFGGVVDAGDADFLVGQYGSSDLSFSRIDADAIERLAEDEDIQSVEGVNLAFTAVGGNPFFLVLGVNENAIELGGFTLIEGDVTYPAQDEVLLGKVAVGTIGADVGDTVTFFGNDFTVVGVYETGEQMQDGGALVRADVLQDLTENEGNYSLAFVEAADGANITELTARIDSEYDGELVTIKNADEISRIDSGTEIIDGASWMISALAIVIGGIGVMNTMIISVFDRIREIGVLKAVGWRRRTVMMMVLGEAVIIGLAAVVTGTLLAFLVLVPLAQTDMARAFIQPSYNIGLWVRATVVAVLVSVIGGLYPAWKAANLSPVEALRYE